MATPEKPTVASPSGAHTRMSPRWRKFEVLLGGTEAMRDAGKEFLPQHEHESDKNYKNRLARATLLNQTELTLNTLSGKPFKEQIVLGEDVPPVIVEYSEDIDLQGNNLQSFCRNWFREAWAKGFSHVLIDHPTPAEQVDDKGNVIPRTLETDKLENMRPYWVHIRPENIIAAYSETVQGKEVLTHVRIREETIERDGWGESKVVRIRVLEPGTWQLWKPDPSGKADEWVLESEGVMALDIIPLVTFYTAKREGLMECKPPLMDLAYLNIEHWQSASDQRNVLTVSRFPILAASGVDADEEVKIGPNSFLTTESAEGKWYYVEHTGAAIATGSSDLETLEARMATYGTEFMRNKPGTETATGKALDAAEATSYLGATVKDFQDCVEQAMMHTAAWLNLDNGGSVAIDSDVGLTVVEASELDALLKMRAQRDISRPALMDEMMRRGIMKDDFDPESDQEILDEEAQKAKDSMGDMFGKGAGTMPQPTPPLDDSEGDE